MDGIDCHEVYNNLGEIKDNTQAIAVEAGYKMLGIMREIIKDDKIPCVLSPKRKNARDCLLKNLILYDFIVAKIKTTFLNLRGKSFCLRPLFFNLPLFQQPLHTALYIFSSIISNFFANNTDEVILQNTLIIVLPISKIGSTQMNTITALGAAPIAANTELHAIMPPPGIGGIA